MGTKTTEADTTTTPEMSSTDTTTRAPTTTETTTAPETTTTQEPTTSRKTTTSEASTLHPLTGCRDQTCPYDGLFPGPEPCSPDFCHCSWGVPHPKICKQGLVFNNSVGVCDWPWNTEDCSVTK